MIKAPSLTAIMEKAPGTGVFWFLQQEKSTVLDLARININEALTHGFTILVDAKAFLKARHDYHPHPNTKIICLSTIKKLIGKNIHHQIKLPTFENSDEAHAFIDNALHKALDRISQQNIELLANLECQVIIATLAMERKGLPFDDDKWRNALLQIEGETHEIKTQLHSLLKKNDGFLLFGQDHIDLNSTAEVKASLEALLGHKLKGTAQSSLKNIDHEAVKLLLRYRENARMLSAYGESFLKNVVDHRVHGNFIAIGSASGRFACVEPNLLALPKHALFQACLLPAANRLLIHFDYGAFELDFLAALAHDPLLLNIFNDQLDIHSMVAKTVFNTDVSKTHNAHLRDQAKILNFGIIYGMGEHALAKQLNVNVNEASTLMHNYFKRFAKVRDFLEQLERHGFNKGYVQTVLGRRFYFDSQSEKDLGHRARVARNMPIQGTGADIVKLALCKVFKRLHDLKLDAHIINVVHDELVIECHQDDVEKAQSIVVHEMKEAFSALLPNVAPEINVDPK